MKDWKEKEFVRCEMSGEDLDWSHLGIRTENTDIFSSPAWSALNLGRKLRHLVHAPICIHSMNARNLRASRSNRHSLHECANIACFTCDSWLIAWNVRNSRASRANRDTFDECLQFSWITYLNEWKIPRRLRCVRAFCEFTENQRDLSDLWVLTQDAELCTMLFGTICVRTMWKSRSSRAVWWVEKFGLIRIRNRCRKYCFLLHFCLILLESGSQMGPFASVEKKATQGMRCLQGVPTLRANLISFHEGA